MASFSQPATQASFLPTPMTPDIYIQGFVGFWQLGFTVWPLESQPEVTLGFGEHVARALPIAMKPCYEPFVLVAL